MDPDCQRTCSNTADDCCVLSHEGVCDPDCKVNNVVIDPDCRGTKEEPGCFARAPGQQQTCDAGCGAADPQCVFQTSPGDGCRPLVDGVADPDCVMTTPEGGSYSLDPDACSGLPPDQGKQGGNCCYSVAQTCDGTCDPDCSVLGLDPDCFYGTTGADASLGIDVVKLNLTKAPCQR